MASRTRIVCLHEGEKGRSIDPIFITTLIRALDPTWIRPWNGSNIIRPVDCGGRSTLIARMPGELKTCLSVGSDTTLMVWADLDHDKANGDQLVGEFWAAAQSQGITKQQFDAVDFVFAKDRLENWIEFLVHGITDESKEGQRVKSFKDAARAATALADRCKGKSSGPELPTSLQWSCRQWKALVFRMN